MMNFKFLLSIVLLLHFAWAFLIVPMEAKVQHPEGKFRHQQHHLNRVKRGIFDDIGNFFSNVGDFFRDTFGHIKDFILGTADVWDDVDDAFSDIVEEMGDIGENVVDVFISAGGKIGDLTEDGMRGLRQAFDEAKDGFKNVIENGDFELALRLVLRKIIDERGIVCTVACFSIPHLSIGCEFLCRAALAELQHLAFVQQHRK